ncbi:hypothetical protein CJU90_5830 [Yarrowia sp. C11]|nr:hypothetical protein CJU90_5830 [Yarrowia sp. C11]KAG5364408.1 hypothetical protein CKK34_3208 [Yarrowia sp. E02]
MSEDLQEYLDQLETVQTELVDDPENADLATLRDELLELIQLLQDDTNADEKGDTSSVVGEGEEEGECSGDESDVEQKLTVPKPPSGSGSAPLPSGSGPTAPKPQSAPKPPPPAPPSAPKAPAPPPAPSVSPPAERPALQSQNALAPKKKKSKWEKQEEALDATKNKWQKFSQKANGGRASMFQSPADASGKVGRVEKPKAKKMKRLG